MTTTGLRFIAALTLCLAFSSGCGVVKAVGELLLAGAEEVRAPEVKPVSEPEAKAFAAALSQAVDASDVEAVAKLIDFSAMVKRALAGLPIPQRIVDPTTRGVIQGAKETGLAANIASQHAQNATYTLIGTPRDQHGQHAVFRSLAAAGGFEHHDFLLSKTDQGVVAIDVYTLAAGELLSTAMRRLLMPQLASDKSVLERIRGKESLLIQHKDAIQSAQQAAMAGRPEEAIRLFDALPEELRYEKHFLIARMSAAHMAGDDERYAESVATIIERFPGDPAAAIASIDHHFIRGEHDTALRGIEAVAKAATPDPYFDVLRAVALIELDKLDDAKKAALTAIEREPTLPEGHNVLFAVLVAQRDHAGAAREVLRMREELGLEFTPADLPEHADFLASPEWKELRAKLAGSSD